MTILNASHLFSHALAAEPDRLHFCAHSHHLWPDATRVAHDRAWLDAAELADEKWGHIFGSVIPESQAHIARILGLDDPARIAFSANTHDLLIRLLSALPAWNEPRPLRVLSTDAEFHSFTRQMRRFTESGRVEWQTVAAEPYETLPERFEAAAQASRWDLVFASHVFFSSGHVFDEVFQLMAALPEETACVVDGYHGFFAVPTEFGPYADRIYYMSGAYKYVMAGEGLCFLVAPNGREERPEITGWFAGFSSLKGSQEDQVGYDPGGARFLGATIDPTAFYRFNAVCDMLAAEGLTIDALHKHSAACQERFLEHVAAGRAGVLRIEDLTPSRDEHAAARRGNFLTFRRDDAQAIHNRAMEARIVTDVRADRLRFGFGLYHTAASVDALAARLASMNA